MVKTKGNACIEVGGLCTGLDLRTHLCILTDRNQFDWLDLCFSTGVVVSMEMVKINPRHRDTQGDP